MGYKKKLILLSAFIAVLTAIQSILPYKPGWIVVYSDYLFVPYQSFRNLLFGWSPLSFGDVMYFAAGIVLITLPVRWVYYASTISRNRSKLVHSLLNTVIACCITYVVFLIGWGGNYYKPSLTTYWNLDKTNWHDSSDIAYDRYLITQINKYAPGYYPKSLKAVKSKARQYYKAYTNCNARLHGLSAKPSIYNFLMQYMGIQGYYNPITGEAQVNRYLPHFMLPFVVAHEMAHQAGVAAEDDANLVAYTVCQRSADNTFRYSAYLNMWLYNHHSIRIKDSTRAKQLREMLNPLTRQHLDTLKQLREKYRTDFSIYSSSLYDVYLKMLQQKHGIMSYDRAVITAWAWEQLPDSMKQKRLLIP